MDEINQQTPLENEDEFFQPIDETKVEEEAADWYEKWRSRIHEWVAENTGDSLADILLFVPDFFILLVGLAKDNRVSIFNKGKILIALAYVISPIDFLPEAILGPVGLVDDAGAMAALLVALTQIKDIDPLLLRQHWRGQGDVIEKINLVYAAFEKNAGKFLNPRIWETIKQRFSKSEDIIIDSEPTAKRSRWLGWIRRPAKEIGQNSDENETA